MPGDWVAWFILVFEAFLASTSTTRFVAPSAKGDCWRSTCGKRKEIFWGQRKVLYSVIHKPSKIPVVWQEKMFLLFFIFLSISLLISILVGRFRDHVAIFLNSLIANGRVWFVQVFYFCKLVVSLILHILKQW